MITLHEPWNRYERRVAGVCRRQARRNFAVGFIWGLGLAVALAGLLMFANLLRF